MNTSKLKTFAQHSRNILKEGVKQKLRYWGFNEQGEAEAEPIQVGGGVIIRGETIDDPTVLSKWKALQSSIQRHGIDATIEEAAYTWFNRLMAIRILSKNGYDTAQLEYEGQGSRLPVILAKARRGMATYLDKEEKARLQLFITDYSQEVKAFSILLTSYCHSHMLLNRVFGRLNDFTELLLPDNILADNGFIHLLNTTDAIAEEDYSEVELIGWLYQFYISEKKDEVFAGFKKNKKAEAEDIPAATQIFTPNWIVKYMVQNTAGRIWLNHHPDSKLKDEMKYLVEAPESPAEGESPLEKGGGIREDDGGLHTVEEKELLKGGDPIHLKFLDPACGSGHILVEGFSLLYDMYLEEFYMPQEAVKNILTHNLFGLELDLRAAQLAGFAVLLAAAKKVPEVLKKDLLPRIYAMPEPANFSANEVQYFLGTDGTDYEKTFSNALQLMQQAKNLGSVMQFKLSTAERNFILARWEILQTEAQTDFVTKALVDKIEPFLDILLTMTESYETVVANPPYMGQKSMNADLKKYVNDHYPMTKSDLFAIFIEVMVGMLTKRGRLGAITMESWMFLSSYEKLRHELLKKYTISSLSHFGWHILRIAFGTTAFILENKKAVETDRGVYSYLTRDDVDRKKDMPHIFPKKDNGRYAEIRQSNFSKIPGSPIAYWVGEKLISTFSLKQFNTLAIAKQGLATGDNNRFLRVWTEVNYKGINFLLTSFKDSETQSQTWVPYSKGGEARKWYGNNYLIVYWQKGGEIIRNFKDLNGNEKSRFRGYDYYFKEAITWSLTASNNFASRLRPCGFVFDINGMSAFPLRKDNKLTLLAYLNSNLAFDILKILNPTMAFQKGDISKLPFREFIDARLEHITKKNVHYSKKDWNSYEASWDFQCHPIVPELGIAILSTTENDTPLENSYEAWEEEVSQQFYQLHANEEEINRIFIDIYGLNDELDPVVPLKDITILQEELNRTALEETERELRKERKWKLEDGKWNLTINTVPQPELAEGELPTANVRPVLPIKRDVVMKQLISYAMGCMMGRYSIYKSGLILANQGETLDDYYAVISKPTEGGEKSVSDGEISPRTLVEMTGKEGEFIPDDDAIIPIMGSNCGFSDDAFSRLRHFIEVVWGSETLTQNINFLQQCLDMDLEKYLTNQNHFWKDHTSRYKKKPIYWLFSSPKGAFQVLVYMHRMTKFTVGKIRDNYLLKHLIWLDGQAKQLETRATSLDRDEQKRLDWLRKAQTECEAYDLELKDMADQQLEIDLDDGVAVNYPKFKTVVAKIK